MNNVQISRFWTISNFDSKGLPDFAVETFREVRPYVEEFLCSLHPFRDGVMCPFVPSALKHNRIYFTACIEGNDSKKQSEHIQQCISFYLERKCENKGFGALIILFPKDYDIGQLLDLHFLNKEKCVVQSLMLGALYPTNQAPSLHKSEYFPLRTPTPTLVIRDMVASDILFLDPRHYNLKKRLTFLRSFIRTFEGHRGVLVRTQVQDASRLIRHYANIRRFRLLLLSGALICGPILMIVFLWWILFL